MATKLTKTLIESASYVSSDNGRCVLWDDELSGFGLRIYPSGKKSFVLNYRVNGRQRFLTLGAYGPLTVDMGRRLALRRKADVIEGRDPLAEKQAAAHALTVREMAALYIERHAKPRKKTWEADQRRLARLVLPRLGPRPLATITRADVADLHHEIGATRPHEANRTVALLSKLFECAIGWGRLPDNHANPARRIQKFKEQKRDRWVTPEEMPRLLQAIGNERNVYIRGALILYLLTGLRRSELLGARREYIDWERRELRLPDTKAGRPHYLPLSAPAMAILRSLPTEEGNPFLFPGQRPGRPLVELKMAWERVRTLAGVPDVRIHDLRRTVGSWLAQANHSLHLIGRVLNHTTPSTTAVYARFQSDTVRQALEDHGRRVLAAMEPEPVKGAA